MKLLGSIVYITSAFYGFEVSLLSTLDLSPLCIFILHPPRSIFKMGCSIRIGVKSWRN